MKIYEIRTESPCLIKTNEGETLLDENQSLKLSFPQKVLVYPLTVNKHQFPFFIDLNQSASGRFFSHYSIDEIELFLINFPQLVKNENIETVSIGNKSCSIAISEESISFENNSTKKIVPISQTFQSYTISKINNFIIVHLLGEEENMWIYNVEKNTIKHLNGDKIEIIDNQIMISRRSFGVCDNQIFQTLEMSGEEIITKKTSISHISPPPRVTSNQTIPIAFLEAIQDNDLDSARGYLSKRLQGEASSEHLKDFFGNFSKIIPLSNNRFLLVSKDKHKIYRFVVANSLIDDIEESDN